MPLTWGGTGQAKAVAARCLCEAIGEDRPGSGAHREMSTGGRARRRLRAVLGGHHLRSGADVGPPPERAKPGLDERWPSTRSPNESEPVAPPPTRSGGPTGVRIARGVVLVAVVSARPELRPLRAGRRASPFDRASRGARLAASMCGWKGAAVAADHFGSRLRRWSVRGVAAGVRAGGLLHARPGRWRRPGRGRYELHGPCRLLRP
jgi:hypothetical protein